MKALRIAIVGVGLIGGSLGLALKQRDPGGFDIIGVDSDQADLAEAVRRGAIDRADAAGGALREAEVVFLCTPVLQIPGLVAELLPKLQPGTVVTDVGSTKRFLQDRIIPLLPPDIHYVGGHPMAGREKSGIAAADANLFQGKWYILTPAAATPPAAVEKVAKLVGMTGAKLTVMDVDLHDRTAAVISHIPHVAAAALVGLLERYPGEEENLLSLAGGGFCDTTRIASSNADMWADICLTNAAAITDGLVHLQEELAAVIAAIQAGDRPVLHDFFGRAKARRDRIIASI